MNLQCPATLLVCAAARLDGLDLSRHKVAWVWGEADVLAAAEAVARRLGVGVDVADLEEPDALDAIADRHPGETVLVVVDRAWSPS